MATITEKDVPYEILIRYGEDGRVQGAHAQMRHIIDMGDRRLADELGPALPLSTEGFPTSEIMTATQADALDQLAVLKAENAALKETIEKLTSSAP